MQTPPSSPSAAPTLRTVALTVVGSVNVDLTARAERLPAPGETVAGARLSREPGGKGANQAVAAARLGARVSMVGAVGDDADGAWLRRVLTDAGVDISGVATAATATGTALIVVDAAGENQIAVCDGANAQVRLPEAGIATDAVLAQLEIPLSVVEELAATFDGLLAVNAAPAQPLSRAVISRVDLVVVNELEYAELPELADARLVAVTRGERGAELREHGRVVASVPGLPAVVANSVGAGDAFCAALTIGLCAGLPRDMALRAACAVGAAAVADPASQPLLGRLDGYLAT